MNNSNCLTHLAIGTAFLLAIGSVFASETSLSDNLITTSKAAINQQSKKNIVCRIGQDGAFGRS